MTDQQLKSSQIAALLTTVQGKIISSLAIIALLLGIVAEGFSIYNSYLQARINKAQARIKEAEAPLAEVKSRVGLERPPDEETQREIVCGDPELRKLLAPDCTPK